MDFFFNGLLAYPISRVLVNDGDGDGGLNLHRAFLDRTYWLKYNTIF